MADYKIDPDFEVPEPKAADFHAFLTPEEYEAGEHTRIFDGWRKEGVQQARITLVNEDFQNPPYPYGVWLEGWSDKDARLLPFGEAEGPGKAISPPLVAERPNA